MTKRTLWVLALVASAWGIAADIPSYLEGDWGALATSVGAPAFAIAGAMAASRRPQNRTGVILLLTAFVWPLGSLFKYDGMAFQQITYLGGWLWVIPLIYLVLAFPSGRLERRRDVWLCWLTSLPAFWLGLLQMPLIRFTHDRRILQDGARPIFEAIEMVILVLSLACAGMLVARVRDKWRRATPPGRRALAPVALTGATSLTSAAVLVLALNYVPAVESNPRLYGRITWLIAATVPIGFMIGLARARARRARMGELVIELGELPTPERFQNALRNALGDPNLVAAFWVPGAQRYLTAEGQTLALPDDGADSVATFLERDGEPLAVIVHDRFLMEDPALVAGATAAARLAVENERLQQEVLEQLTEVRASRSRIIQAGDDARRRFERDLHDGAQQRLVTLGLKLQSVSSKLGPIDDGAEAALQEARAELRMALGELRDLARGLHPLILTDEGLGPAIESLSARFPLPVTLHGSLVPRLPEPIETAAYFVASEALANVAKHAQAKAVEVAIAVNDGMLSITLTDDGIGGASIAAGSGLRGLADRLQALDGSLSIWSPVDGGTRLAAQLPTTIPNFDDAPHVESPLVVSSIAERRQERAGADDLLRVRDLEVFYGDQQVLFGVNVAVDAGEIVAVLGSNGAGKSTLARTIAGLHDHLRGSIRLAKRELTDIAAEQRTRAGLAFIEGGAGVFEPLTVDENLRLFSRHAGITFEEVRASVFDVFPVLADKGGQRAGSLSRGEQHMLALTRAVISDASLVIVDELSLGLAPRGIDEVCGHIRRLNAHGVAVLFVEQSVDVASRLAERAYFLDAGRVVFDGPIADLDESGLLVPVWMEKEVLAGV